MPSLRPIYSSRPHCILISTFHIRGKNKALLKLLEKLLEYSLDFRERCYHGYSVTKEYLVKLYHTEECFRKI